MRVLSKGTLRSFWEKHPDAEAALTAWYNEASKSDRNSFNDIQVLYTRASNIKNNRIVFRIKGNDYRLIVHINYKAHRIGIKFIGTHADYDKINAETIDLF